VSKQATETKMPLLQEVMNKCSRLSIPAWAILELTYRCNLRCVHCFVDVTEDNERSLTLEDWQGVIDQLKAAGTMYLLFTGGEVMVREDFLEIAAYARRHGFFVGFLTNCTLITPAMAQDIGDLQPYSIATSLYGASAATHESVTRVAGSFEKTIEGIKLLVNQGLTPLVQTLAMKSNLAELTRIKTLVNDLGAVASVDIGMAPSKTGSTFPFRYEPSLEELVGCGWRSDVPSDNTVNSVGLCKAGKALCSVSPEGDVFPCIMFPLKLGNLRKSNFDEIWRLEPCAELRYLRSMRRTDLYACQECHLAEYCQRCTGIAYLESGRFDGPGSSACRQAEKRWRLNQTQGEAPC
jgi:radical SAM protein with 4Fe4S-binding SPASM domain